MLGKIGGRRRAEHQRMRMLEYHQCNGHELGQTSGDYEGQGSLVCNSPWGHRESDRTERLNNNQFVVGFQTHNIFMTLRVSSVQPTLFHLVRPCILFKTIYSTLYQPFLTLFNILLPKTMVGIPHLCSSNPFKILLETLVFFTVTFFIVSA